MADEGTSENTGYDPEEEFVFEDDDETSASKRLTGRVVAPPPPVAARGSKLPWILCLLLLLLLLGAGAAAYHFYTQAQLGGTGYGPLEASLKGEYTTVSSELPGSESLLSDLAKRDADLYGRLQTLLRDGGSEEEWQAYLAAAANSPYAGLRGPAQAKNQAPQIVEIPGGSIDAGALFERRVQVSDAEGDKVEVVLVKGPQGASVAFRDGAWRLRWQAPQGSSGAIAFLVAATDAQGNRTESGVAVEVIPNKPPRLLSSQFRYRPYIPFTGLVEAVDPDGDPISFRLVEGPDRIRLDSLRGTLAWEPKLSRGTHKLRVAVSDGKAETVGEILLLEKSSSGNITVRIDNPSNGQTFNERVIALEGQVDSRVQVDEVNVVLNGTAQRLRLAADGSFKEKVVLRAGRNELIVKANSGEDYGAAAVAVTCSVKPSRMLATLTWDQEYDADLYVVQPNGEVVYYPYKNSRLGGVLDVDNVQGYGPENYTITASLPAGVYQIRVNFFSDNRDELGSTLAQGPCDWNVRLILDEGTPEESVQDFRGSLAKVGDWQDVTEVSVLGTPASPYRGASLGVTLKTGNELATTRATWTDAGLPQTGTLRYILLPDRLGNETKAVVRNQADLDMIQANLEVGTTVAVICNNSDNVEITRRVRTVQP